MSLTQISRNGIIAITSMLLTTCSTAEKTAHISQPIAQIEISIHNYTETTYSQSELIPIPRLGMNCLVRLKDSPLDKNEIEHCILRHLSRKDLPAFFDLADSFDPINATIGECLILRDNSLSNSLTAISNESPALRLKLASQPSWHHIPLVLIPGDTAQQYKYLINEDAPAIFKESALQVLRRPAVLHAESKPEGFILTFSINDPKASTGSVFFHDKNNALVGRHHEMLVSDSGAISQELNGGKAFFTDGTPNFLRIPPSVILFEEKKSLHDINHAYITLKTKTVTTAELPLQTITQKSTSDAVIVFPYLVKSKTNSPEKEAAQ